jgi:hypothetical protein
MSFRALNTDIEEVVIIDILPEEERKKWAVSEELRRHLATLGIPQFQLSCYTKAHVFEAFQWCARRLEKARFVLQFTAHGNKDGIGLKATGEFISWAELSASLKSLNQRMRGSLILNMVACKGIYGAGIQAIEDPDDPFFDIVGPLKNIGFVQAKRIAKIFYQEMLNAVEIPHIVMKINQAENEAVLWCRSAQLRRKPPGEDLSL